MPVRRAATDLLTYYCTSLGTIRTSWITDSSLSDSTYYGTDSAAWRLHIHLLCFVHRDFRCYAVASKALIVYFIIQIHIVLVDYCTIVFLISLPMSIGRALDIALTVLFQINSRKLKLICLA